jgi:hypothetical protein
MKAAGVALHGPRTYGLSGAALIGALVEDRCCQTRRARWSADSATALSSAASIPGCT